MDEKQRFLTNPTIMPTMRAPFRPTRPLVAILLLVLGCVSLWRMRPLAADHLLSSALLYGVPESARTKTNGVVHTVPRPPIAKISGLVPLEAHIMSKCPDAKVRTSSREEG